MIDRNNGREKQAGWSGLEALESRVLLSGGDLDTTFGDDGFTTWGRDGGHSFWDEAGRGEAVAMQADGKIVLGGIHLGHTLLSAAVFRFNADGSVDTTFDEDGMYQLPNFNNRRIERIEAVAVQPDGKILVGSIIPRYLARVLPDGGLDPTFGDGGIVDAGAVGTSVGRSIKVLDDGRIVTGDSWVSRYMPDGTPDLSFADNGLFDTRVWLDVNVISQWGTLELTDEGGVMVAANTNALAQEGHRESVVLYKLTPDGQLDTDFGEGGRTIFAYGEPYLEGPGTVTQTRDLAMQADGKVVLTGGFGNHIPDDRASGGFIARMNADGSIDTTFGGGDGLTEWDEGGGRGVAVMPDGRIVAGGIYHIGVRMAAFRVLPDGTPDASFDDDGTAVSDFGTAYSSVLQTDGKFIVSGKDQFGDIGGTPILARFDLDGSLDQTFGVISSRGTRGHAITDFPEGVHSTAENVSVRLPDGKIIVMSDDFEHVITQLLPNGQLDPSFGEGGHVFLSELGFSGLNEDEMLSVQPDGKILFYTQKPTSAFTSSPVITRLLSDGSLDPTFGINGTSDVLSTHPDFDPMHWPGAFDIAQAVSANQVIPGPSGEIYLVGASHAWYSPSGSIDSAIMKLLPDGTLDPSFGNHGVAIANLSRWSYTDSNGQTVHTLDNLLFGAVLDDGSLIVSGFAYTGIGDTPFGRSFTTNGIVVGKLRPDGTWDTSFADGGWRIDEHLVEPTTALNDMKVTDDGRIFTTGWTHDFSFPIYAYIAELDADGQFVTPFGDNGVLLIDETFSDQLSGPTWWTPDIEPTPDGGLVAAIGRQGITRERIMRLDQFGNLDTSFGVGGFTEVPQPPGSSPFSNMGVRDLSLDADGSIVVIGNAGLLHGEGWLRLDVVVFRLFLDPGPTIESVDVGRDAQSIIVQFGDHAVDVARAEDTANYTVLAANGDANGDGDFFNDGDEFQLALTSAEYDSDLNRVVVSSADAIFDDAFRIVIDGDDDSDGSSGLADPLGHLLEGGDFATSVDLGALGLVEDLLVRVESLGLNVGSHRSLIAKLEAAAHLLGVEPDSNQGIIALMDAFMHGLVLWYERGQISEADRDSLLDDALFITNGLTLL